MMMGGELSGADTITILFLDTNRLFEELMWRLVVKVWTGGGCLSFLGARGEVVPKHSP